jgi:hypothetical protein
MPCLKQLQELGSPEVVSGLIETITSTNLEQLSATVKCLSAGPEACRRKRSLDEMQEQKELNTQLGRACQSMIAISDTFCALAGKVNEFIDADKKRRRTNPDISDLYG